MLSTSAAEVARAMLSVFNGADLAALDTAVVPDYVEHALPPGVPPGLESLKEFVRTLRTAMPDFRFDIEVEVVQDERVALYGHASGTLQGRLFGGGPTGRHGSWQETHLFRVVDGRVVEHWDVIDFLAMRLQLGLPLPPAA